MSGEDPKYPEPIYTLSIKGLDALTAKEELAKQVADNKTKLRDNDYKAESNRRKETINAWVIAAIGWVVSPLIALAIEHFSSILAFIKSIFHK